jgi:hypothetical protein
MLSNKYMMSNAQSAAALTESRHPKRFEARSNTNAIAKVKTGNAIAQYKIFCRLRATRRYAHTGARTAMMMT